jgi:hypothetical protein
LTPVATYEVASNGGGGGGYQDVVPYDDGLVQMFLNLASKSETSVVKLEAKIEKTKKDIRIAESEVVVELTIENVLTMEGQEDDGQDDTCYICGKSGELLCCETCPKVAHLRCVGLTTICDDEDWFCSGCMTAKASNGGGGGEAEVNGGAMDIVSSIETMADGSSSSSPSSAPAISLPPALSASGGSGSGEETEKSESVVSGGDEANASNMEM